MSLMMTVKYFLCTMSNFFSWQWSNSRANKVINFTIDDKRKVLIKSTLSSFWVKSRSRKSNKVEILWWARVREHHKKRPFVSNFRRTLISLFFFSGPANIFHLVHRQFNSYDEYSSLNTNRIWFSIFALFELLLMNLYCLLPREWHTCASSCSQSELIRSKNSFPMIIITGTVR